MYDKCEFGSRRSFRSVPQSSFQSVPIRFKFQQPNNEFHRTQGCYYLYFLNTQIHYTILLPWCPVAMAGPIPTPLCFPSSQPTQVPSSFLRKNPNQTEVMVTNHSVVRVRSAPVPHCPDYSQLSTLRPLETPNCVQNFANAKFRPPFITARN
ncbi:hypothetical protein B0H14DRAFT_2562981 [Mycena olivaceomarginata]|nr:hypothetical protein B0H14DRAFT_2562981 [Mycena olivaceomarginata]